MFELKINREAPIKIVAEIGCNHQGDMKIAHEMIKVAADYCQVDFVKFQKRCPKVLLTEEEYNRPYNSSFGKTYGEHREALEFDFEQHETLKDWCEEEGVKYACSVWDIPSAKEIMSLLPDYIKIPSAMNLNFPLLKVVYEHFRGPVHISTGMTTADELTSICEYLKKLENSSNMAMPLLTKTVLYHCTSCYPCRFEDLRLKDIVGFRYTSKEVGFSGHHQGIAVDIAAITLGATWIERHFTLDRTWKGTDHAASLEPDGMKRLVRDIEHVKKALDFSDGPEILSCEEETRKKMKKIVFFNEKYCGKPDPSGIRRSCVKGIWQCNECKGK